MPDLDAFRRRVEHQLTTFLAQERELLAGISPDLLPVADAVLAFTAGGKRLRPAFCWWGALGAGLEDSDALVSATAALELLQACALVHDDLMDGSDTRRGQPSVHRRFAATHRAGGWQGDPETFGESAALLVGDLCLVWAGQLLGTSGLPAVTVLRARPTYDLMCTEVMAGQYLDVLVQATGGGVEEALRVARFKSAKYTIERPLHLGAAFAGAGPEVMEAYSAYGLPLGEAFQLRDDVLGVFGDPVETGKPAGDDLREGKRTVLVALTLEQASPAQAQVVRAHLGDLALTADGVAQLQQIIIETGALAAVEEMVEQRLSEALAALGAAPISSGARTALAALAELATRRSV